jgi:Zn-finger nucleic acid-binding protein
MNATSCPSCRAAMTPLSLPGKLHGTVELDLCFACQGIWFDGYESHQIAPGGLVELFKLIHEHRDDMRMPLAEPLACPRCGDKLLAGLDVAKSGKFTYHRCLQGHGRFSVFAQFMIEKGFVRQLSPAEVRELAARIQTVRCSGCGAPIDIRKDAACSHCRAPIAILDPDAVEQALAGYHQAEIKRSHLDPNALADAIIETERQKSRQTRDGTTGALNQPVEDLLVSGVTAVWNLIRR